VENILAKLKQIQENPGYFKGLTPEEQAELFLALLTPKKKILRKPVVITGIDGKTPEKDKDYLSKEASLAILNEIKDEVQKTLKAIKPEKGEKGKDAEITDDLIEKIITEAVSRVPLPQFPYETIKTVTATQDALLNVTEDILDIKEDIEELKKEPKVVYQSGTIGKNQVYKFIAQAVEDGTIPAGGEGGASAWGDITGTLSDQTDLQTALDGKVDENTAITGATKTKITYDAKGLVTVGADATTADIADSSNRRYVTDAQQTVIGNTSGTNTGDNATNTQYSGLAASKQDTLVSATNIKTINGSSILGSGDLVVGGGISDGDKGDITVSGTGSTWTIDNGVVTLAKQADMATASLVYRKTAGAGAPEVNTLATLKTDLGLTGTNSGDQTSIVGITGTKAQFNTAVTDGDIVYTDAIGATVQAYSAVLAGTTASFTTADESKLDGIAAGAEVNVNADWNAVSGDAQILNKPTISGSNTGDQTTIVGITGTKAQFDTAVTDGNFLYAGDVTTNATHTGDATGDTALTVVRINGTSLAGLATGLLKNTTGTGVPSIAVNSDLPVMSATVGGAVPTPPNNTTTFLRGDGTFATPPGGGVSDGDKGDITVSASGATWTIDNDTIGLDELSATGTPSSSTYLRGDNTWATIAGGGDVIGDDTSTTAQNIVAYSGTGGKNITELTGTQGDVLYHNGTNWAKLGAGTVGQYLVTGGAGANPSWAYGARVHVSTSAGATTTGANTTPVSVTDAVFTYAASAVYRIWVMGRINSTLATTGGALQFDLSSAVTAINVFGGNLLASSGTATFFASVADDTTLGTGSSGVPAGPVDVPIFAHALLVTGANTGTCQLRFRSEVNAVTELMAGAVMVVERVA
jgi:hypothetical protein